MTDTATTTYSVPEISCGHCKSTIEAAVQGLGDIERVEVDIDAKTVTVEGGDRNAIVTVIEDAKTFEWLGRLVLPGVFDGRHRFELVATPTGGTRLVQAESFSGVIVRFLRKSLDTQTVQGFELMNTALRTRAENVMAAAS